MRLWKLKGYRLSFAVVSVFWRNCSKKNRNIFNYPALLERNNWIVLQNPLPWQGHMPINYYWPAATRSLSTLAALNLGTNLSFVVYVWVVPGTLPVFPFCKTTSNMPKPAMLTLSFASSNFSIASVKVLIALSASIFVLYLRMLLYYILLFSPNLHLLLSTYH